MLSRRNGENNLALAPMVGYATPRITGASIVGGGATSTDTSGSFPRAVSMLQEEDVVLELDVSDAGWSLSQWDTMGQDGAVVRLDGIGWNSSCIDVQATDRTEAIGVVAPIVQIRCRVTDWQTAAAAMAGAVV